MSRPLGSKNKTTKEVIVKTPSKRGRKPGSKNKPKLTIVENLPVPISLAQTAEVIALIDDCIELYDLNISHFAKLAGIKSGLKPYREGRAVFNEDQYTALCDEFGRIADEYEAENFDAVEAANDDNVIELFPVEVISNAIPADEVEAIVEPVAIAANDVPVELDTAPEADDNADKTYERVIAGLESICDAHVVHGNDIATPWVFKVVSLNVALGEIQSTKHKSAVDAIRAEFLANGKSDKYDNLKKLLPFFSFAGTFIDKKSIANKTFLKSSGVFLVDIDKLKGDINEHKQAICAIPEVIFCFDSPTGNGFKVGILVDPNAIKNDTDFKDVYPQVEAYFFKEGYTLDPSCKDVRRACFASHDPEIYINYDAKLFVISDVVAEIPKPKAKPEPKPSKKQTSNSNKNTNTEDIVIKRLTDIMEAAVPGNRHQARLHGGRYIGGCIAGGLIQESVGIDILNQLSDRIAEGRCTSQSEAKTLYDAVLNGKADPITNLFGKQHTNSQQEPQEPHFKNPAEAKAAGYVWSQDVRGYVRDDSIIADTTFSLAKFALNGSSKKMRETMLNDVFVLSQIALLGQITIIYAKPNTGKTLLTLWLLIQSIRAGRIKAEDVYYINADDSHKGLVEKLELGEEHGFYMLSPGHNDFKANDLTKYLAQLIINKDAKGKVIILDTAKKFVDLMDKKSGSRFMDSAREFVTNGGTLILLAHTNKNRDADNKVVFGGTSDLVDDGDCAYTLDQRDDAGGIKTVLFENIKKRGDCSQEVAFSYTTNAGQSYLEYLNSIVCLDPEQAAFAKASMDAAEKLLEDQVVIDAVITALNTGDMLKTALVTAVHDAGHSKKRINEVLPAYVGTKWVLVAGGKNSHLYSLI